MLGATRRVTVGRSDAHAAWGDFNQVLRGTLPTLQEKMDLGEIEKISKDQWAMLSCFKELFEPDYELEMRISRLKFHRAMRRSRITVSESASNSLFNKAMFIDWRRVQQRKRRTTEREKLEWMRSIKPDAKQVVSMWSILYLFQDTIDMNAVTKVFCEEPQGQKQTKKPVHVETQVCDDDWQLVSEASSGQSFLALVKQPDMAMKRCRLACLHARMLYKLPDRTNVIPVAQCLKLLHEWWFVTGTRETTASDSEEEEPKAKIDSDGLPNLDQIGGQPNLNQIGALPHKTEHVGESMLHILQGQRNGYMFARAPLHLPQMKLRRIAKVPLASCIYLLVDMMATR